MVDTTDLNLEQNFVSSQIQKSSFLFKKDNPEPIKFKKFLNRKGAETQRELPTIGKERVQIFKIHTLVLIQY